MPEIESEAASAVPDGFDSLPRSLELKQVLDSLPEGTHVAILTQDNPDPDAIGSALGVQRIFQQLRPELKARIYHGGYISHPQNRTMVEVLGINLQEIEELDTDAENFVVLVDAASTGGKNIQTTDVAPNAVFDHHEDRPPEGTRFVDIRSIGSTCSIITEHLYHLGTPIGPNLATALLFGIKNDTNGLISSNTTKLDYGAFSYLRPQIDQAILTEIENYPLPNYIFDLEQEATENKRVKGSTLVSGLGYLDPARRDGIPYVADRFLRLEDIDTVVIHAIVGDRVHASLRTCNEKLDANHFIQQVFGAKYAGAKRDGKGGAQIPIGWLTPGHDLDDGTRNLLGRYINEFVCRRVFSAIADETANGS